MRIVVLAMLIGLLSGVVAALAGVGGGIVMVPLFKSLFGLDQKQAIATSLAVIIPTSILATFKYSTGTEPLVDWKIALTAGLGACIAAFFATDYMRDLDKVVLTRVFAVLLIVVGARMLLAKS